jgi:hypothetical protein
VILRHHRNEAEYEKYKGFHQFNFDVRYGTFVIWNRSTEIIVADFLSIKAEIMTEFQEGDGVVYVHKQSEFFDTSSPDRFRDRVKSMVSGTLSHFVETEVAKLAAIQRGSGAAVG